MNYNSGDKVYLPAQLCHEASLPPDFTRDTFKMRELQKFRIVSANDRKVKILKLVEKFIVDETLQEWGISMDQSMRELKGQRLAVPQIVHDNRLATFKDFTDRKVPHNQPLILRDQCWAFCYQRRDENLVNKIVE